MTKKILPTATRSAKPAELALLDEKIASWERAADRYGKPPSGVGVFYSGAGFALNDYRQALFSLKHEAEDEDDWQDYLPWLYE